MHTRNLAGMIFLPGIILLFTLSFFNYSTTPPEPVARWNLDHFETDYAIDQVTGIADMISGRFHYSHNAGGELIRYPTHLKRRGKSAPPITGAFTLEAWVSLQIQAPHWNPIFNQGIDVPPVDNERQTRHPGLVGAKFGNIDLSRVVNANPVFLDGFDQNWRDGDNDWSGRWRGYIIAPYTGTVEFSAEADDGFRLEVGNQTVIDGWGKDTERVGRISMEKGKSYPVVVEYYRDRGDSYLRIFWKWEGNPESIVPSESLFHTDDKIRIAESEINNQALFPDEKTRLSFGIGPDGKPGIKLNLNGDEKSFHSEKRIPLKTWTHLAVSYDGKEILRFFVNGKEAGSFGFENGLIIEGGGDMYVGKSHREHGMPYSLKEFTGIIGSVVLYDECVGRDDLQREFQSQKTGYNRPAAAVYPFSHVMVYDQPDRFAAWPANGGLWVWDDEMVVAFEVNWFRDRPDAMDGHATDRSRSNEDFIARSKDGGKTWTNKEYPMFDPPADSIKPFTGSMEFTHPDFAFKSFGSRFYYSYDRGRTWGGPFLLNVDGVEGRLSARTDYLVEDDSTAYFFLAVNPDGSEDRAFCAYTCDGGKTIRFHGWMTDSSPEPYERWVMPSTVRLSPTHLVSALRRKINIPRADIPDSTLNWVDVYQSADNGKTWEFLSMVAKTGDPNNPYNGNPPSMFRLDDGRLGLTYAVRNVPGRLCAKISSDNGRTWGDEIILRQDARNWDIGYTRSAQRPDGQVVTIYYFATPENRSQFIAATIWDPDIRFVR
jgi:hypothetical protein